jgi:carbon-monoxide dehydrogenase medium subunit
MSTGASRAIPDWLIPTSLSEALEMRNSYGDDATVIAGGAFIGILMS